MGLPLTLSRTISDCCRWVCIVHVPDKVAAHVAVAASVAASVAAVVTCDFCVAASGDSR